MPGIGVAIPARPGFVCPEDSRREPVASATVHSPVTDPQKDDVRCFQAPAIHPVIRPLRPPEVVFTAFSPDIGGWRQPAVETAGDRLSLAAEAKERWLKPPPSVFSRGGLGFGSERPSGPWQTGTSTFRGVHLHTLRLRHSGTTQSGPESRRCGMTRLGGIWKVNVPVNLAPEERSKPYRR